MILEQFHIQECISDGENSLVYRATRLEDNKKVILKTHHAIRPTVEETQMFLHEYEIIKDLQGLGVSKLLGLIHNAEGVCLVFEDEGLTALHKILKKQTLSTRQGLSIAIQLVQTLHHIHENKVLHKDINPSNICLSPDFKKVVLVDFEIASRLTEEQQQMTSLSELQGTLAYISPEQTGRMNRQVDYRSDFYSLGATLYEVFTGKPVCNAVDRMELVHFHIAKLPTSPLEANPKLEPKIGEILLKLLEKAAEDRYQSCIGIQKDLERCLAQLEAKGTIGDFIIASDDYTSRLTFPQKLYGRDAEVKKVLRLFQGVSRGSNELLLISGVSGVGKTVVVNEVHRPITEKNAFFVTGKAEQFKAGIPYAPVIAALQQLIHQISSLDQMELLSWKLRIKDAVKGNGAVLFEVLPELALILEDTEEVEALSPLESHNRFFMVLLGFVSCFGRASSPLVFFFDVLQWAEQGTFEFIERLLQEDKASHIFIIGSYRQNEVLTHPTLQAALLRFEEVRFNLNRIDLDSLSTVDLSDLVVDCLHLPRFKAEELTQVCFDKTAGNPFFFKQFLEALYQAGVLFLDQESHQWSFDLQQVIHFESTGNVLDLMAKKVGRIHPDAQELIKAASVFGVKFNLALLSNFFEEEPEVTLKKLQPALDEGVVLAIGDQYKFVAQGSDASKVNFRFLHDRVQQATYLLLSPKEQKQNHLQIARLLYKLRSKDEELVYDIMNHYNNALELITDAEEVANVLKYNFIAGKKAMRAAAFRYALRYFEAAINMLPDQMWEEDHEFVFGLYLNAAESAYLTYQHQKVGDLFQVLFSHAKTVLDESKIYAVWIPSLISENKLKEAIEVGLEILEKLGCPLKPTKLNLLFTLLKVKWSLFRHAKIKSRDIGLMKDPVKVAAVGIMGQMGSLSFLTNRDLLAMLICKGVDYTINYGVASLSSFLMAGYAFIHTGPLLNLKKAKEYAEMSLDYFAADGNKKEECRTLMVSQGLVGSWLQPYRKTIGSLNHINKIGLQNGDFEFASTAAIVSLGHHLFPGLSLFQYQEQMVALRPSVLRFKHSFNFMWFKLQNQVVENYMGKVDFPTLIDGASFQEKADLQALEDAQDLAGVCIYNYAKGLLAYDFGNFPSALQWFQKTRLLISSQQGAILEVAYCYFSSLTALANYPAASGREKRKLLSWVHKNQKLSKRWAQECPENHLHSYYLVEAEKARVLGLYVDAQRFYDQAISTAQTHNIPQWVALANEKAGEFYFEQGITKLAQYYLKEALYQYSQWGGAAKCEYLQQCYQELLGMQPEHSPVAALGYVAGTTVRSTESFDLESIFKASQALSGEIRLERLVESLTRIMIQNAGASRGVLITMGQPMMVMTDINNEEVSGVDKEHFTPIPAEEYAHLPKKIINQAKNLLQPVIVGNVLSDKQLTFDPYFDAHVVKSLACIPILHNQKLLGLIYLENRFAYDSIPPERVRALQVLSSQAAISMENANLYHGLEDQVAERTKDLHQTLSEMETANKNIMDSLNYAQRIQGSLLPSSDQLNACFSKCIVLWEPRDTVGGDLYFCEKVGDDICLAVMDCTGHGVPGALMTMLAASGIQRIVREEHCLDPSLILSRLSNVVNNSLYHKDSKATGNDGLDAAVIVMNGKKKKLQFAGAMMNLYQVRQGEIKGIKGDRTSLGYGKMQGKEPFQIQEIPLEDGDRFYMMSDGLQDQVGSSGFPLGRSKILAWLLQLGETPMYRHGGIIMHELKNFMGLETRRDDITMIGFEFDASDDSADD